MATQKKLLKELRALFSSLESFETPRVELEQYETGQDIGSHVLATIVQDFDDIDGKIVADLGCGTGRLGLGALYCGAAHVVGFDACASALNICQENYRIAFESDSDPCLPRFDLVHCDVVQLLSESNSRWHDAFDVIIMNPPFGTKNNAGIDVKFLQLALQLGPVVYSMHKSSTRTYLKRVVEAGFVNRDTSSDCCDKANRQFKMEILAQLRFDVPKMYKFHREAERDVNVDFIRCTRT